MKRTFKLFCVTVVALLCVFGATLCGCTDKKKATFEENSLKCDFECTDAASYKYSLNVRYRVNVNEEGVYYATFLVEYNDKKEVITDIFQVKEVKSDSIYRQLSETIYSIPEIKNEDVTVSFMDVWQAEDYEDDTPYFALAIAFGVAAAAAVAAGVVLGVLSIRKKRAKAVECAAEEQSDVAADELPAVGQNTEDDTATEENTETEEK